MTTIKWWVGFPPGSMHAARLPAQFITNTVTSVCISWARSRGPVSKVSPCTMELPEYALKGLQLLADPSHFSDKTFHILVEAAFESLLNPQTDGATLGKRECCSSLRGRGREDEGLGFFPHWCVSCRKDTVGLFLCKRLAVAMLPNAVTN